MRVTDLCLLIFSASCSGKNLKNHIEFVTDVLGFNAAACNTIILSVLGLKKDWDEFHQAKFTLYVAVSVSSVKLLFVLISIWYVFLTNNLLILTYRS